MFFVVLIILIRSLNHLLWQTPSELPFSAKPYIFNEASGSYEQVTIQLAYSLWTRC